MEDFVFSIDDLGCKDHDNIIYVYRPHEQNAIVSFAGWLYNRLFLLNLAYMIKAKACFEGCTLDFSDKGFKYKMLADSYEECHRVVFFEEDHFDYLKEQLNYNPYLWNANKCRHMIDIFKFYFDVTVPMNTFKNKRILGIHLEKTIMPEDPTIHERTKEEYAKRIIRVMSENQVDCIFLHDIDDIVKGFIEWGDIEVYDLKNEPEELCLLKFMWADYFIGAVSPFTYILSVIKGANKEKFNVAELVDLDENNLLETDTYAINDFYGKRGTEVEYDQFLMYRMRNDKNACFCKFMGRIAKLYFDGESLSERLMKNKITNVILCGAGTVGAFVCRDLLYDEGVRVAQIVDRKPDRGQNYAIASLESLSKRKYADAIIVTTLFCFEEIYFDLRRQGVTIPIIPIELIVYDVYRES